MSARTPRYGTLARQQQGRFRATLSSGAREPVDDKGQRHPHLLAHGHEFENLYPSLRGADGALALLRRARHRVVDERAER